MPVNLNELAKVWTYWQTPWADGIDVTLGFSSSTTVGMISYLTVSYRTEIYAYSVTHTSVHSKTSNSWTNVQPSLSTCFTELPMLEMRITGYSDGGTGIFAHVSNLAAL